MTFLLNPFESFPAAGGGGDFDLLADISWAHAYWAEDPDWTDPGNGNNITDMRDAGSEGIDLQPDATRTIEYQASYANLNSRPAWIFDGTQSRTADASGDTTKAQPNSIVVIGWLDSTHSPHPTILDGGANTTRHLLRNYGDGGNIQMFAGSNREFAGGADGAFVLVTTWNGASSSCRMNGSALTVGGTVGTHSLDAFRLGSDEAGANYFKGAIAFMGIKSSAFASEEESALETFANSHYGITIA